MNQAHSPEYNTREGQVMPAPFRRRAEFCSRVSTPERAGDTKLTANLTAVAAISPCVNMPDSKLIAAAKDVLAKCKLTTLIVVDSRESAIAVLYGINLR